MSDFERFNRKIDTSGEHWLWTGKIGKTGYGQFGMGSKVYPAQRAAYELFIGPLIDGSNIDHLCRNRSCVRPDHLEQVTPKENSHRRVDRDSVWHLSWEPDHARD